MRQVKAKRIRAMLKHMDPREVGPLMGDQRTVRYHYRLPDGRILKTIGDGPEGAVGLMATYTLTRPQTDPRRMYRRIKKEARHG